MSIAVIGQGFVGGSLTRVLLEKGVEVFACDKAMRFSPMMAFHTNRCFGDLSGTVYAAESVKAFQGIYFVCLPTPMNPDGSADVSIVEGVLKELATLPCEKGVKRIAVVKSTVPPGTAKCWNEMFKGTPLTVVFNPEFLREASAVDDMRNQKRIILGGPRRTVDVVKRFYESVFPDVPVIKTSSTSAEMVKYVTNVHLAVKVLLANEFWQICQAIDETGEEVDFSKVVEYAIQDERLGRSHWNVPGYMPLDDGSGQPAFGVGGSCFIKDLNALIFRAKVLGVKPLIMEAAWQKNLEVRPQRDWEKLVGRAVVKKQ